MNKWINFFTYMLLCSSLIISISSCNKDEDTPDPVIPEVTNLALKNAPTKSNYYEGDILDLSGLVVRLTMDNGDTEDIVFESFESKGLTCSPINGTEITEKTNVAITHTSSGKSVYQGLSYMIVKDIDDNVYQVVKIGEQFWMTENLKVTKFRNRESIPSGPVNIQQWSELTTPAYSWDIFNSNEPEYKNIYGLLYNWNAVVDSRNICPDGWHIPSDAEWTELSNYLGNIANKMKAKGSVEVGDGLWVSPNDGGTNESGFTALPGGGRNKSGMWTVGGSAHWWSSTEIDSENAWERGMNSSIGLVRSTFYCSKINGFSVRCIKD